jgi:hypothetical protein
VPARRRPAGIRVHVHPALDSQDIRRHKAIRVTTPARTALDIAPRLTDAGLARAVNQARLNAGLRATHLAAVIEDIRTTRERATSNRSPRTQPGRLAPSSRTGSSRSHANTTSRRR